jgi:fatty acid desaturase
MSKKIDHALLALMAIVLAILPFAASGYVIYVVNLLMVFVVLALGLHLVIGETGQFAPSMAWASIPRASSTICGIRPSSFRSSRAGCWPPCSAM